MRNALAATAFMLSGCVHDAPLASGTENLALADEKVGAVLERLHDFQTRIGDLQWTKVHGGLSEHIFAAVDELHLNTLSGQCYGSDGAEWCSIQASTVPFDVANPYAYGSLHKNYGRATPPTDLSLLYTPTPLQGPDSIIALKGGRGVTESIECHATEGVKSCAYNGWTVAGHTRPQTVSADQVDSIYSAMDAIYVSFKGLTEKKL